MGRVVRKKRGVHLSALAIVRRQFPQVLSVVDAKEDLVVEVTKLDCKLSTVRNHKDCAMAVACKRTTEADGMIIAMATAYIIKRRKATRYRVPNAVAREIVSFDRNGGFAPGVYTLKAPSIYHALGSRTGGNKTTPGAGNPRRGYRHVSTLVRTSLLQLA